MSLHDALFYIKLDSVHNIYQITHGKLYEILKGPDGKQNLAKLVGLLCQFLSKMHQLGMSYGNLRSENIMIKFTNDGK